MYDLCGQVLPVSPMYKYEWWTFDGTVPGPMVRCRVGDVLEVGAGGKGGESAAARVRACCVLSRVRALLPRSRAHHCTAIA